MKYSFEHIENYLDGKLSAKEQIALEQQLTSDQDLAKAVNDQRATRKIVELYAAVKTKDKIREIYKNTNKSTRALKPIAYAVAASLLLLMVIGSFWHANQRYSNKAIYASEFEFSVDNLRSTSPNTAGEFQGQLDMLYNNEAYEEAISLLESFSDSISSDWVQFQLGNLHLKTDSPEEAITAFQYITEKETSIYKADAQWLMVLAQLRNNNEEKAIQMLDTILNSAKHPLSQKASDLKRKLQSKWRHLLL